MTKFLKRKFSYIIYIIKLKIGLNKPGPRYYLKKNISVETFFKGLLDKRYVLLRWFDQYPNFSLIEDYDILISEEAFNFAVQYCVSYPNGGQPIDFYTPKGLRSLNFNGTSYFPSDLAEDILSNSMIYKNKIKVPNPEFHLLSFAYHIVFHKGYSSGIPKKDGEKIRILDHDYLTLINNLKEKINLKYKFENLIDIYEFLISKNLSPTAESLNILSRHNRFISDLEKIKFIKNNNPKGELVVFIIREYAYKNNLIESIKRIINNKGILILQYLEFNEKQINFVKNNFRGGYWGKGNFIQSGGSPFAMLICFDYCHDLLSNNIQILKNHIRNEINKSQFFFNQANMIHSTDNEFESIEYIKKISYKLYKKTVANLNKIREIDYFDESNLLKIISKNGSRSKVTLIKYKDKICIKKSFKLNMERFLKKEIYASSILSKHLICIPKLIEKGDNFIILEYFENILTGLSENNSKKVIRNHTRLILDTLYEFWKLGYAHIDFNPFNIIITKEGELKICDFEFLYKYENQKIPFLDSYDLKGVPSDFNSDLPLGYRRRTLINIWDGYLCKKEFKKFIKYHSLR